MKTWKVVAVWGCRLCAQNLGNPNFRYPRDYDNCFFDINHQGRPNPGSPEGCTTVYEAIEAETLDEAIGHATRLEQLVHDGRKNVVPWTRVLRTRAEEVTEVMHA